MYEHHKEPVLPRGQFLRRVTLHGGVSVELRGGDKPALVLV